MAREFFAGQLEVRDVARHAEQAGGAAKIEQGRRHQSPDHAAVLAPEARLQIPAISVRAQRAFQPIAVGGIHPYVKRLRGPADHLVARVARRFDEALIDVEVDVVRQPGDADGIDRGLERGPVALLALGQGILGPLARGDVLVQADDADDFAIAVAQRHLGRAQPDQLPVGRGLRFVVEQLGLARIHHLAVVGAIEFGLRGPAHGEVVLADQFGGRGLARILGEGRVAAEVTQHAILPEHAQWRRVYDCPQQGEGFRKPLLRLLAVGDVLHRADGAQRLAVRSQFDGGDLAHPANLALGKDPVLEVECDLAPERLAPGGGHPFAVDGRYRLHEVLEVRRGSLGHAENAACFGREP